MTEEEILIGLAEGVRKTINATRALAISIGQEYTFEKYLDYYLYMPADEYWQSSSATC